MKYEAHQYVEQPQRYMRSQSINSTEKGVLYDIRKCKQ